MGFTEEPPSRDRMIDRFIRIFRARSAKAPAGDRPGPAEDRFEQLESYAADSSKRSDRYVSWTWRW